MVELAWDMDAWTPIKKKKIPERAFLMTLDFPEQIQNFFYRFDFRSCLSCVHNCNDLSCLRAVATLLEKYENPNRISKLFPSNYSVSVKY